MRGYSRYRVLLLALLLGLAAFLATNGFAQQTQPAAPAAAPAAAAPTAATPGATTPTPPHQGAGLIQLILGHIDAVFITIAVLSIAGLALIIQGFIKNRASVFMPETTTNQMLISNALFALACLVALPFLWKTPDLNGLALMILLGLAGGFGQFLLFESFRYAPASAIAPIEYTALVWAFLLGFLVWSEVPPLPVFIGASLIVGACLALVWSESRRKS